MKKCLLLLFILTSCQTPNPTSQPTISQRGSASVDHNTEDSTDHVVEEKTLNAFNSMMSAPTDGERSQRIANYLDRQRNFFYIAQGLLGQFDEKLDQVYDKYAGKDPVDLEDMNNKDFSDFSTVKTKNLIAWEFSERNLHEMLDVYYLTLKHANDPQSPYQKANIWAVTNIKDWIKTGYNSGDRMATIVLSQALETVNKDFITGSKFQNLKQSDYTFANLSFYANRPQIELQKAYDESLITAKNRPQRLIDVKLEKEWLQHSTESLRNYQNLRADFKTDFRNQLKNFNKNTNIRTPQSPVLDVLEPSPYGTGNVTGNRLPNGKFAFTFDDGPHPEHTEAMINVLKKHGVHGTFFWQTKNLARYPKYSELAKKNGFNMASHSYSHQDLSLLLKKGLNKELEKEIDQAVDGFTKIVGQKPTMYRCPYGACGGNGSKIRTMIADQNMLHIFWNVDSKDWSLQDPNPTSIFNRARKQVDLLKRGIILFHDVHPQSVIATDMLIKYVKDNYKIEPLNKLIEESRGKEYYSP